jgi:ABC-type multidrug transport system ATPase subunit
VATVSLNNIGKKFNREWIFRNLTLEIPYSSKIAILGSNGSGKSTLLQVISGFVTPNEGSVIYRSGNIIPEDKIKDHISFASPYLQLIEDFTLSETIDHVAKFKPFKNRISTAEIISALQLESSRNKFIRHFSSGMKQRLKLGLAILCDSSILLLDEPVSNLDKNSIEWFTRMITDHTAERTVIVCSNAIKEEYSFCTSSVNVEDYKSAGPGSKVALS